MLFVVGFIAVGFIAVGLVLVCCWFVVLVNFNLCILFEFAAVVGAVVASVVGGGGRCLSVLVWFYRCWF